MRSLQPLEQGDRIGFAHGRVRREKNAFGPIERRAALCVRDVEPRAVRGEILDDVVRAAIRGAVNRRDAHRVHGVHVVAELVGELHGFEQRVAPFVEGLGDGPIHAGRHHQRRRAGVGRDVRIGAVRKQQAHDAQIPGCRGAQERRLSREVDPRDGTDDGDDIAPLVRKLARARVRVRSGREQALDQREGLVANARGVVGRTELEVAQIHGGPERRLAVPIHRVHVRAGVEQDVRDGQMVAAARAIHAKHARVDDRADQRRDAVAVRELDVRAALDEQARDVEMSLTCRVQRAPSCRRRPETACRDPRASRRERCRSPRDRPGGRLARRYEARRLFGRGRGIDGGARVEQHARDLEMPVACGNHQRRLTVARVARVDGRAVLEQRRNDLGSRRSARPGAAAARRRGPAASRRRPTSSSQRVIAASPAPMASVSGVTP